MTFWMERDFLDEMKHVFFYKYPILRCYETLYHNVLVLKSGTSVLVCRVFAAKKNAQVVVRSEVIVLHKFMQKLMSGHRKLYDAHRQCIMYISVRRGERWLCFVVKKKGDRLRF